MQIGHSPTVLVRQAGTSGYGIPSHLGWYQLVWNHDTLPLPCWSWQGHTDKDFSWCHAEAKEHVPPPCIPDAFLEPARSSNPDGQTMPPWSSGPGGQGDLHSWAPWNYNNGKDSLDRMPHPGHCTGSRLKHTSSLVEKDNLLVLEIQLEGQASGLHTSREYRGILGKCKTPFLHTPLTSLSSLIRPRKELIELSRGLIYGNATQGSPPDFLVWRPAGLMNMVHRTIYLHTSKPVPQVSGFQIA